MRILLTGGAGFIGSHLAERLLERGTELTILDNFNDFYSPEIKEHNITSVRKKGDFSLWREDLLNEEALKQLFHERQPELILHLAAYAGVRPSLENPALYSDVNVTGTIHLLELAREHEVKAFIFGSSSSVYGVNSKVPFHEDDPLNQPISPYASTKRAAELLCYNYHHNYGLPVTSLRFFTVYGPRQRPEMAIHKFTRMIQREEEIPVYHQGESKRDYTYVDDIVKGILSVVEHPFDCEILNLGNSRTIRLLDLIQLIERALGKTARIKLLPAQKGDVPITYADISRARRRIDYQPTTSIEEGVSKFVEWYLETGASVGRVQDS
jgi:UDP-glucuronate 4-epimerase